MESFLKADVFFVVTTIAVLVLTVFLVVIFVYVLKVIRNVRDISEIARRETKSLSDDIQNVRTRIREEGFRIKTISYITKLFSRFTGSAKRSRRQSNKE